jgi:hypothetical protein
MAPHADPQPSGCAHGQAAAGIPFMLPHAITHAKDHVA